MPAAIQDERVRYLNDKSVGPGANVFYWMQASQRTTYNHALEYAASRANELGLPLVVCFGLMDDYPEANERHYAFMLEGLRDVEEGLKERGVKFVVKHGQPKDVAVHYAADAALLVCDRGYLRHQKAWREHVAAHAPCPVVQVESDVVVPVDEVSDKRESGARTIRPRLRRQLDKYLRPLPEVKLEHPSLHLNVVGDIDVSDPAETLRELKLDRSVGKVSAFVGGTRAAYKRFDTFLEEKLSGYQDGRNEPAAGQTSTMSAYLHFGQISPLELALKVREREDIPQADREAYLEELIVRRELSMNFAQFEPLYDHYDIVPEWARKTLADHRADKRYHLFTKEQLEAASTHDPYWNAAQQEMNLTGFMHNRMRMYWGKKILEWTPSPEEAFEATLYLNNKFFLCGRNPNAYANVAWVFGLHDRPWAERPVFGKVRYMTAGGLERKFDIQAYVAKVVGMAGDARLA